MLEEGDLIEMGITDDSHRSAMLRAVSKCPPVQQTGCQLNCLHAEAKLKRNS